MASAASTRLWIDPVGPRWVRVVVMEQVVVGLWIEDVHELFFVCLKNRTTSRGDPEINKEKIQHLFVTVVLSCSSWDCYVTTTTSLMHHYAFLNLYRACRKLSSSRSASCCSR